MENLRAELAEKRKGRPVVVRSLEVDSATGNLFFYRKGEAKRVELSRAKDVAELISQHESELRAQTPAGRVVPELVYLILYPAPTDKGGGEPTVETLEKYQKWFGLTPYSLDRRGS